MVPYLNRKQIKSRRTFALVIGLLGSIAFVWLNTYQEMNAKHEQNSNRIDRSEDFLWEKGFRIT
jgi:hypothetical protein